MRRAPIAATALAAALSLGLTGCGLSNGLYNVPLPGGADLGSHPYTVTAQFDDALDLVPQSGVKVNDVAVGRVTKISLEPNGKVADVQMSVNSAVQLPANAIASIQQTSLLGEKYVSLGPPLDTPGTGRLVSGDTIALRSTTDGVEVEQLFGALSLVLNGGGIGQLHEITTELNKFAGGREPQIRDFLASTTKVIGQFNRNRTSITQTLDALNTLSATLRRDNDQIAQVLRAFAPGIAVLARQRKQLITLLTSLNNLSTVTTSTLQASKAQIIGDLRNLGPILSNLAAAGTALPQSLQVLLTYPFPDAALRGLRGDYLNGFATTDFNTPGGTVVNSTVSAGSGDAGYATAGTQATGPAGSSSAGSASASSSSPPSLLPPTTTITSTPGSSPSSSAGSSSSGSSSSGSSSSSRPSSSHSSSGSSSPGGSSSSSPSHSAGSSSGTGSGASSSGGHK